MSSQLTLVSPGIGREDDRDAGMPSSFRPAPTPTGPGSASAGAHDTGEHEDAVELLRRVRESLRRAANEHLGDLHDLAFVDLRGNEAQTLRTVRELRTKGPQSLIVAIGGADPAVAIAALEEGADVHLPTGIRFAQAVAQVRALLRRPVASSAPCLYVGNLQLDSRSREAVVGRRRISFTIREFEVLLKLARSQGIPLSADELRAPGPRGQSGGASVKFVIRRIRRKLRSGGKDFPSVLTRRGFGYVLAAE